MRALLALLFIACGPPAPPCPAAYPNPTSEGLCCDARWEWCLAADGGVVGAP